ncbi:YibE/F family protein [uncultured Eubacterium sp.]|uniref:YibE/F family protein n=1 Tax=uncultured Eubacterium sp. TaxID=165185 RepID=UPI0025F7B107|nr:YibE/F family protein [uncultured Eubacterium sp.]
MEKKKSFYKWGKYLIVIGITLLMFLFFRSVERVPLLADDNMVFVKAVVVQNDHEDEQAQASLDSGDTQQVVLEIRSGAHKGEKAEAYSLNGYLYGADCKVGTKVIASLSEYDGELSANVYNYDREAEIIVLLAVFFGLMWLVGGKKGFNSILALLFTFVTVIMMYIPLMYIGISPFIAATVSVVIITLVTFMLIADFQMKSIGAMLGTIFGVIVSGLIALVFGHFGHVTGFNVDDIENLIYVGQNSRLDIGGMLFSGILIASLGAVMDVAMSVSTSLHEIKEQRPGISAKEIFKSGVNIGRDMIGTMSNTLILAYVGGSLGLVMIIYAYSYQMHQIMNMYSIAIEIMRGVAGTIGIILTVPITSLIMSVLLTREKKSGLKKQ